MTLVEYINLESARDGTYDSRKIRDAINFLSDFTPDLLSKMEIEMCIMHAAFIIDKRNEFKNNYNVKDKGIFIDHVDLIRDTDFVSWCKYLYENQVFMYSDRVIINLVFNWLNGSLSNPERIVK